MATRKQPADACQILAIETADIKPS
jgi:hypothetical protein